MHVYWEIGTEYRVQCRVLGTGYWIQGTVQGTVYWVLGNAWILGNGYMYWVPKSGTSIPATISMNSYASMY